MIQKQSLTTFFFTLLLIFFTVSYAYSAAISEDVDITADTIEYITVDETYIGKGSVVIKTGETTLKADVIEYSRKTQDAVAEGNVYYEDNDTKLEAERVEMNLATKIGTIYKANIVYKGREKAMNYYGTSEKIERVSEKTYLLKNTKLTTCNDCPPAWSLSGRDVKIDLDEKITAKGASFKVKDHTVLYSPYLYFPFQEDREPGFLMPEVGGGDLRGFTYKQGFFWPIDDFKDLSIYNDFYAKIGWGKGVDFRYIHDAETRGEFWLYHLKDTDLKKNFVELKGYHNQPLPFGMEGYLKVHTVSHDDYYQELDSTSEGRFGVEKPLFSLSPFKREERLRKYLETNAQINKIFHGGRAYLRGQYRRNLEGSSDLLPQVMPELGVISYTRSPDPNGIFSYNFDVLADNFWSEEGTKGQRLNINPVFYVNLGRKVAFSQKIGFRETLYRMTRPGVVLRSDRDDKRVGVVRAVSAEPNFRIIPRKALDSEELENLEDESVDLQPEDFTRELIELTTTLSTKFYKKYGSFKHLIEPFIRFDYINSSDELDVPNFDNIDVRPKTQTLSYELRNKIEGKSVIGWFRVQHGYTFLNNVVSHSLPILVETTFSSAPFVFDFHTIYDTYQSNILETQTSATYVFRKNSATVGRVYREVSELDQMQFGFTSRGLFFDLPLSVASLMWYDINGQGLQNLEVTTTYDQQCWSSTLFYRYRENDQRFLLGIELKGIGSLGALGI